MAKLSRYAIWAGPGALLLMGACVFLLNFPAIRSPRSPGNNRSIRESERWDATIVQERTVNRRFVERDRLSRAEKSGNTITGRFECFASNCLPLPQVKRAAGSRSLENTMYARRAGHRSGRWQNTSNF